MPPPPSTNRSRKDPDFEQMPGARVDTIALRGRISAASSSRLRAKTLRLDHGEVVEARGAFRLNSGVTVRFDAKRGHPEASLEFSVPRILRGTNETAATLSEVRSLIREVHADAAAHLDWETPPDGLSVMRLDLARDFVAIEAERHLAGLVKIPARQANTHSYQSDDGLGVATVYRETKRWKARLYVRDLLSGYTPRPGNQHQTLRYELELRSTFLKEHGLARVSELAESSLQQLALQHFRRCRFHVGVGDSQLKLHLALDSAEALASGNRRGVLGQLVLDALGEYSRPRDNTVVKYRRMASDMGLVPADLLSECLGEPVRFLDFAAGRLALAA